MSCSKTKVIQYCRLSTQKQVRPADRKTDVLYTFTMDVWKKGSKLHTPYPSPYSYRVAYHTVPIFTTKEEREKVRQKEKDRRKREEQD